MSDLGFAMSNTPQQNYLLPPGLLPGPLGNITNHLLVSHAEAESSCSSPCPLDDLRNYSFCHIPMYNTPFPFGQYSPAGADLQMNLDLVECGAEIQGPDAFIAHFNAQHRHQLTAAGPPNPFLASANLQHGRSVLASTETMSPPATPLDTSDSGRSSTTPSPLTPLSDSTKMPHVKQARSTSIVSFASHSVDMAPDEEHRCLWREEGSAEICGHMFADAEDLFKHASETHIKHAQKGAQGFRCGWDDCPRSDVGAAGFPQRSKIERHMQTHIGRQ